MNVVRVGYATLNDICCVIVLPDQERGTEGLAWWNGEEWKWLHKRDGWTLALERFNDKWTTLDFSGHIRLYEGSVVSQTLVGPFGLNHMCIKGPELFAIGTDGQFVQINGNTWQSITNSVRSDLYSVCATDSFVYACGVGGVILKYAEGMCQQLNVRCNVDFTSLWCSPEGRVFAAGGVGEQGVLIDVDRCTVHPLPSRQYSLWGISTSEIYGVDLDGQIWIWDGASATRLQLSDQIFGHCLSRSRFGLVIGGEDVIAIKEEDHFRIIPVTLDPSFLSKDLP